MASIMTSSLTSLAPASIIITLSLVEATVRARSDLDFSDDVGLKTNSPSTRPTIVAAHGPSKGMSEMLVASDEPSIARTSGGQSGSTDKTRLSSSTSFL